jgi:flagellar export protein FliJ
VSRGFRLAAVERMRTRQLEDAGRTLARARQALLEATARRDLLVERLLASLPTDTDPARAHTVAERRVQLRERIAAADTRIAELAADVLAARDGWGAARSDLRAAEALHERYRQAVRAEQDRREQWLADDLSAARHRTPAIPEALQEVDRRSTTRSTTRSTSRSTAPGRARGTGRPCGERGDAG